MMRIAERPGSPRCHAADSLKTQLLLHHDEFHFVQTSLSEVGIGSQEEAGRGRSGS
jgi:hypothetical protein